MRYPHHLRITTPGEGGTYDPDTGAWTPAAPNVHYDGAADVQDEGAEVRRSGDNEPVVRSDAVAFLEDESAAGTIPPEAAAEVTWEDGIVSQGRVMKAVRLDGKVHLEWLEATG